MLDVVASLTAAFLSELGAGELLIGLLFAAGLMGCVAKGREHDRSGPTHPAHTSQLHQS